MRFLLSAGFSSIFVYLTVSKFFLIENIFESIKSPGFGENGSIESTIDEIFDVARGLFDPSPEYKEVDQLIKMAKRTPCMGSKSGDSNSMHYCAGLDIVEDERTSYLLRAQQSYIPYQDSLPFVHLIGTHNSFASEVNGFGHPGFVRMVKSYKDNRLKGDLKAKLVYNVFFKESEDCLPSFDWDSYVAKVNCSLPPKAVAVMLTNFFFTKKYRNIHTTEALASYINQHVPGLTSKSIVKKKWFHLLKEKHLQLTGTFKLVFANQAFTMKNQLIAGVRMFGIQPVILPNSKEFILCHTSSEFRLKVCDKSMALMTSTLVQLSQWLNLPENRREVILLKITVKGKWQFPENMRTKLYEDLKNSLGELMLDYSTLTAENGKNVSVL